MSDNFEAPGRTFGGGYNPRWTALHKNHYTNDAQHFYFRDNTYTKNYDKLVILAKAADTDIVGFDKVTKKAFAILITSNPL